MASSFRPDLLAGKVAVVSGGGSGIGKGIVTSLTAHGCKVVITGRREEPLKETVASLPKGSAAYVSGDVRDPESCAKTVAKAVSEFGRVDILVNNAAGNFATASEDLSLNAFKTVMDIDLFGSFNMAKACLEELKKTQGVVISISATLYYKVYPFQMHAAAAKAAVDVMTNTLGVEWGSDYGIRAVSIAPGPIEGTTGGPTGRVFGSQISGTDTKKVVPIGRYGTVDDIANAVLYVASPAGSFINSTTIVVDGASWFNDAGIAYQMGRDMVKQLSSQERKQKGQGSSRAKL